MNIIVENDGVHYRARLPKFRWTGRKHDVEVLAANEARREAHHRTARLSYQKRLTFSVSFVRLASLR